MNSGDFSMVAHVARIHFIYVFSKKVFCVQKSVLCPKERVLCSKKECFM